MEKAAPKLKDCRNAEDMLRSLRVRLSPAQRKVLDEQKFLLLPIESTELGEALPENDEESEWAFTQDEMLGAFTQLGGSADPVDRKPYNARLITPDVALHAWHKGFSRLLEHVEKYQLHGLMTEFLEGTLANARDLRKQQKKDSPVAEALAWTEARFAAAWVLLGPAAPPDPGADAYPGEDGKVKKPAVKPYEKSVMERLASASKNLPAPIAKALEREVAFVMAAQGMLPSPLFGMLTPNKPADYTQFKPRSHYANDPTLGGYFRAMMFLGRNGFEFSSERGVKDGLVAALVMARAPKGGSSPAPLPAWKSLMEITGFFAGQSDDVTYTELRAWLTDCLGGPTLSTADACSPETAAKLLARTKDLRPPLIVSSGHTDLDSSPESDPPSFRIFGQRFSWDARIFDRFTRGAPDEMPSLPSALMVPAAFGDEQAAALVTGILGQDPGGDGPEEKARREAHISNFKQRLPEIRAELAAVEDADWFASMAAKQLHVISTLAGKRGANHPAFMRSDAFGAKNLESMLGSLTELKHDTVLYAKQVYAEMGDAGDEEEGMPPPALGLVQPDLRFWREMERLSGFAVAGLVKHKLIPDVEEEYSRFQNFHTQMTMLRMIAEKQAAGKKLTDEEWEAVRTMDFLEMASPILPYDEPKPGDGKCAIVTDVATDAGGGEIRFLSLCRPLVIIALVNTREGPRMVAGLAYNFLEFDGALSVGRMTDAEWQEKVYRPEPETPVRGAWQVPITRPASAAGSGE